MRKIFLTFVLLILLVMGAAALWIFQGPKIALYVDRYGIIENSPQKITSVEYHGEGTAGTLFANRIALYLDSVISPAQAPTVGSTKDNRLAIALRGKVFPLGPLTPGSDDSSQLLTATPDTGDDATLTLGHSRAYWPNPFEMNFMTGVTPSWKRHTYQRLRWTKPNGSKLEMVWRYQQFYYDRDGWANPGMTQEGQTGLIRIEISP